MIGLAIAASIVLGVFVYRTFFTPEARNVIRGLLEANGIETFTWIGTAKDLRYREGVLEEGETVSVGGAATRELDLKAPPSGPRALPVSFVVRGTGAMPLIISDDLEAHGGVKV